MKWWLRQQLYVQILIAIVLGVALGLAFGDRVSLVEPAGIIFIRLLKMLIVPLTFLTLVSGITKLESIRSLRLIGGLALLYYALSSLVAGTVGIGFGGSGSRQDFRSCSTAETLGEFRYDSK